MPTFPRTVLPNKSTDFMVGGPAMSWTQQGKMQARSLVQMGRLWVEEYPPLKVTDATVRGWLTLVRQGWALGTVWDIVHRLYLTRNGLGNGSVTVNGGGQTGSTLSTTGWTGSFPYLRTGDIIRCVSLPYAMDVTADVNSSAITIWPPIPVGGSPPNGDGVQYSGVILKAVIAAPPDIPLTLPGNGFVAGLKLTFREAL